MNDKNIALGLYEIKQEWQLEVLEKQLFCWNLKWKTNN